MKKFLSVILAVAMVMSLFCMVPASAENINTWPYMYEDFEDGEWRLPLTGSVGFTEITDTPDGSAKAVKMTVPASGNKEIKFFPDGTGYIRNGDTFRLTMDMKLPVAVSTDTATMYLHYLGGSNSNYNSENFSGNGYVQYGGSNPSLRFDGSNTSWQKATCEFVYTGNDVYLDGGYGVMARFPSKNETEYDVYLDNVECQIIRDTVVDTEKTPRVIFENDFSEGMDGFAYNGTTAEGSGLSVTEDGVLQMVDTDSTKQSAGGHVKFTLDVGEPLQTNKLYLLSYKAKIVEAINNQDYETPTAYATTQTSKHRWTMDGIGNGSILFEDNSVIKCDDKWNNVGIVFNVASETAKTFDTGVLEFRWWIKYDGTGSDTAIYQFDDFKLVEIEGFVDGDFDYGDFKVWREVNETNALAGIVPTITKNWTSVNASVSSVNISSLHSAPYMRTMYMNAIDGTAQNSVAVYLEAGKGYKFSTFVDPCAVNSCGTLQVTVNYTYTDGTEANTVKLVDIAPTVRGYKEYTAEFTTPSNMATAELVVTELGTGSDVSRFETSKNLAYYTDDWSFTKLPSENIPAVSAEAATAAGGIVTLTNSATAPQDVTVSYVTKLTATKDGVKSYIGSTAGSVITVPEAYRTGYALAAEVTPIGSNGYIGKTVTVEVPEVPVVVDTTFTATAANGATLTSPETLSGKVIWVAYDTNGKMLDWAKADIAVGGENGETATVPVPDDFDATGAEGVKVMLWEDMIDCVPMAEAVEY